jgi:predicted phosphoribosyltransferase
MFIDRTDAGKRLGEALEYCRGRPAVVYGLPRGGVVVAARVARFLDAPLDLIVVRKIGHPLSPEYAIGAVTTDGEVVLNDAETATLDPHWLTEETASQLREAVRRRDLFLKGRKPVKAQGKTAILVDDGIATGFTIEAAIRQLRKLRPAEVILAVPVAPADMIGKLRTLVDDAVVLTVPRGRFGAIGAFYQDFEQVDDQEVLSVLEASRPRDNRR